MAEKPEDLNLPTAVITRLVKEVVPEGVNISKEARSAISKSASVFILYLTSCANNLAQKNKRKTLAAQDVFQALDEMEFEQFSDPLKKDLEVYRKEQKGKEAKKKEAAEKRKQSQETAEEEQKKSKKSNDNKETENEADDDDDEVMEVSEESEKVDEGEK